MFLAICLIFEGQLVIQYLQKMKLYEVLGVDNLHSINCWETLADLQKVIPFHANRRLANSTTPSSCIAPHDLLFATSFIATVLFSMVKASRPMTYKHLRVEMINWKRYHKPNE